MPTLTTIPELFAAQVHDRRHEVAVSSGGSTVTFGELDERTDRIAAWLVAHGVGVEDVVAVELQRGHDLIAVLIGTLKTGAAYLPLEVGIPQVRRDKLATAAGAVVVVSAAGRPAVNGGPPVLALDDMGEHPPFAARRVHPDGLAYLSFTSGSTGLPKAVAVPHRAVVRLVRGGFADLGPDETFLLLAPVSFDASTFEIWAPLLTGGRLAIHPPGPLVSEELVGTLADEKVTTLWLTAGLFHRMVDHHLEDLAGLRQLLAGGDVLSVDHVNRFVARHPSIRLINGYGPTENTTFTTCHTLSGPVAGSVPIGRPLKGTGVRTLDEALNPSETGELYVTGAGLSRGYVGQPSATAVSFVPDPFAEVSGARMYRTGDLVRQTPEGIEFLGRGDRQVKIRGFRVEPSEVEREVAALPGVGQAVVLARKDSTGENGLTAYLLPAPDEDEPESLPARVRRTLRTTLPAAMIPAAFVTVEEFPITVNGKVDPAALPEPGRVQRDADNEFVAARSATEQLVCDLWAEALGLDRVGALDDFFELGGNSLLAMDLISRTELVFDVELPIRALLHHPSVEEFASAIGELLGAEGVAR
ncbi:amino acid adenylation domain-containing protein [Streptomyces sp. NPDC059761]|uniref:amino acid adenylation domain-containing protein n=1 Tax=Streptomyces sp. NPDC059761 TaxID=3346937 RepID=UPI00366590A4